jgi:nicotinamide mononucleotide transporter
MPLSRPKRWRLALGAFGAVAIGWFTSRHTDAALPWTDAATLSAFQPGRPILDGAASPGELAALIVVDVAYRACFSTRDCCPLRAFMP